MANKVKYTTQEAKEKYNQLVTKGKYKEGLNILYALYKKDQSDIQVLSSLGLINETINNIDEAIAFYKEAISKGNDLNSYINLISLLLNSNHFDEAYNYLVKGLKNHPNNYELNYNMAKYFYEKDDMESALDFFQITQTIKPNDKRAIINIANINQRQKKYLEGLSLCDTYLKKTNDDDYEILNLLGTFHFHLKNHKEADKIFNKCIKKEPNNYRAYLNLGISLYDNNEHHKGLKFLDKANKIEQTAEANYCIGNLLMQIGSLKEASIYFQKAIDIDNYKTSASSEAFRSLVNYCERKDYQKYVSKYKELYQTISNTEIKSAIAFALSKIHHIDKDYPNSALYLKEGNLIENKYHNYSSKENTEITESIINTYKKPHRYTLKDKIKYVPIFIVGMPRSGSSLIEQMLSATDNCYNCGELSLLPDLSKRIKREDLSPEFKSNTIFNFIRSEYIKEVDKLIGKNKSFFTDKLPQNFLNIGAIINAFPEAKIINMTRNRNDNLLSIYQQKFTHGISYAFDEENIVDYYDNYLKTMKTWHKLYPKQIYNLKLENLIKDVELELRQLFKYIGINYTDKVNNFYKNDNVVKTASAAQVRKPLFNNEGSWKNYEYLLPKLFNKE